MKLGRIIIGAAIAFVGAATAAHADPARFWISASKDSPVVPEAPTINAAVGRQRTLYIWAQPATDGAGFRILQDFSLDIVTQTAALSPEPQPIIDFVDGTFRIYNDPVISGKPRFEYTADSLRPESQGGPLLSEKTEAQVLSNQPDAIKGLQGLSLITENVVGLGNISDPNRCLSCTAPAWRVAAFDIKPLQVGSNMLFLQIGFAGMVYQGAGGTEVVFGNNATPIYDASNTSHRQLNLANDSFDLQVTAVPFSPGDYNSDGSIGAADYIYWRSTFGQSITPGEGADGNGNGVVDAADYVFWRKTMAAGGAIGDYNGNGTVDAADYILWRKGGPLMNEVDTPGTVNAADYIAWRSRFGNTGSGSGVSATAAVPEPTTLVLLMFAAAGCCLRRDQGRIESTSNSTTRETGQQSNDYEAVLISSCNWIVREATAFRRIFLCRCQRWEFIRLFEVSVLSRVVHSLIHPNTPLC